MPQFNQVAHHLAASIQVIMVDGIAVIFSGLVVDHHQRNFVCPQLFALLTAERRGADDDAIGAVFLVDGLVG